MASLITPQFERYIAEQTIAQGSVVFDEFIFANIPGLNENNLAQHLAMPTSEQIVHRQHIRTADPPRQIRHQPFQPNHQKRKK